MEPEPFEQEERQGKRGEQAPEFFLQHGQADLESAFAGEAAEAGANVALLAVGQVSGKEIVLDGLLATGDDLLHPIETGRVSGSVSDGSAADLELDRPIIRAR